MIEPYLISVKVKYPSLIRPVLNSGSVGMNRLRIFLFPRMGFQSKVGYFPSYCRYPFIILGREKQLCSNHMSQGHMSQGHMSQGHMSHGHMSHGHMSHGHMSHGHMSHGHMSHGHMSHGTHVSWDTCKHHGHSHVSNPQSAV